MFGPSSLLSLTICCLWVSMAYVWTPRSVRHNYSAAFVHRSNILFTDMSSGDINAIVSKLSRKPAYITQEIVDTDGSMGGEYTSIGDVQEYVALLLHAASSHHTPATQIDSGTPKL